MKNTNLMRIIGLLVSHLPSTSGFGEASLPTYDDIAILRDNSFNCVMRLYQDYGVFLPRNQKESILNSLAQSNLTVALHKSCKLLCEDDMQSIQQQYCSDSSLHFNGVLTVDYCEEETGFNNTIIKSILGKNVNTDCGIDPFRITIMTLIGVALLYLCLFCREKSSYNELDENTPAETSNRCATIFNRKDIEAQQPNQVTGMGPGLPPFLNHQ